LASLNADIGVALLFLVLEFCVFSAETLDAAGGIDQFLFPCIKWMAAGADFNPDVGLCRTNGDFIAAGTPHRGFIIFGVDIVFHIFISFQIGPLSLI
jgi:hypothetical protein